MLFYSASAAGFYDAEIHGDMIPDDAVAITDQDHADLLAGQSAGLVITFDVEGKPVLAARPVPSEADQLAAERAQMICSRFQARAALHLAGMLPAAETAVAAEGPIVRIAWADAAQFRRDSPSIASLAAKLGLTDVQVDDLFRSGMQITA